MLACRSGVLLRLTILVQFSSETRLRRERPFCFSSHRIASFSFDSSFTSTPRLKFDDHDDHPHYIPTQHIHHNHTTYFSNHSPLQLSQLVQNIARVSRYLTIHIHKHPPHISPRINNIRLSITKRSKSGYTQRAAIQFRHVPPFIS